MDKQMNWEEAKQKVAEKYRYSNMIDAMQDSIDNAADMLTEAAELWQQANIERIKELEEDRERLDWLQKVMTPKETYCEIYFAGLRDGFADATEFQIESNPWDRFQSIRGKSVRDVIDKAKQLLK